MVLIKDVNCYIMNTITEKDMLLISDMKRYKYFTSRNTRNINNNKTTHKILYTRGIKVHEMFLYID